MARAYRFKVGDRVQIHATPSSSVGCKEHDGEVVTIKALCPFTWAYELEELPDLWANGCFKKVEVCRFCGETFTQDELKDLRQMGERYHLSGGCFICPDCYDDFRRMPLEDQAKALLEEASAHA